MKRSLTSRFKNRLEKLMGRELLTEDLSFLQAPLPISELERLKEFSAVNSTTLERAGVEVLQNKVSGILADLGFQINEHRADPRFAQLLVAERPGKKRTFITLVTHSDTVLANYREFSLDLSGGKAFASGVIDNKGGLIVGLSGLERFLKHHPNTEYGLRVICSPNEEMGSIGFTEMFRECAPDTGLGLGLEPALDSGSIIHQRRGNRWYEVTVTGVEAHAGRSYGLHVNAAHDLAAKVTELAALTNYRKHISVNVGHFSGGKDRFNIICGSASMKLDVRFATHESRDQLHHKIERILNKSFESAVDGSARSSTTYKIVDDCPPFSLSKESRKISRQYAALISQLEQRKILSQPAGGAGDVNYLSAPHNLILDGLGPVGGGMHTNQEFVDVGTLATRSQALAGYLLHAQKLNLKTGQKLSV